MKQILIIILLLLSGCSTKHDIETRRIDKKTIQKTMSSNKIKTQKSIKINNTLTPQEYGLKGIKHIQNREYTKGRELLEKGCNLNDGISCYNLGIMYEKAQGVTKDLPKSIKYYTKSCDNNFMKGCYNLGVSYYKGIGVTTNKEKAFELYTKACNNGEEKSGCYNLGFMYHQSESVQQNKQKAIKFYNKSCNAKNEKACYNLALLYLEKKDNIKLVKSLNKACNYGSPDGCSNLGIMYEKGVGMRKDASKAFKLYTKACSLGSGMGCNNVGVMYINNENTIKAQIFFKKSCDMKYVNGCKNYKRQIELKK